MSQCPGVSAHESVPRSQCPGVSAQESVQGWSVIQHSLSSIGILIFSGLTPFAVIVLYRALHTVANRDD